jgi:hypothetical protein
MPSLPGASVKLFVGSLKGYKSDTLKIREIPRLLGIYI